MSDDDHSQYLLLDGRSGGQTAKGGTDSSDNLTITSTAHNTKGVIDIGSLLRIEEENERLGIGVNTVNEDNFIEINTGAVPEWSAFDTRRIMYLKSSYDLDSSGAKYAVGLELDVTDYDVGNTANISGHIYGIHVRAYTNSAAFEGVMSGNQIGIYSDVGVANVGTTGPRVSNIYGYYANIRRQDANAVISNTYGLFVGYSGNSGNPVGTAWGFHIAESTAKSYLGGKLGIGDTSPDAKLHIQGTADEVQNIIQANATQTTSIVQVRDSSDTVHFEKMRIITWLLGLLQLWLRLVFIVRIR